MDADPDRYGRSFADVYDRWYADRPADDVVAFVAARCAPGASVFELGVGTGRVALPLAAAGFVVSGLDTSAEMIERLRAKPGGDAVDARVDDAADIDAYRPDSANAVLAVFNLLFNLIGPGQQQRCLDGVARSLRPGGMLVVEAFVPDPITERRSDLVTRSVDTSTVILIATETDPDTQIVHGGHIEVTEDGMRLRPWQVRMATPDEVDALAAAAGLELAERWEDFVGTPYVDGVSSSHVSVYRRPSGA